MRHRGRSAGPLLHCKIIMIYIASGNAQRDSPGHKHKGHGQQAGSQVSVRVCVFLFVRERWRESVSVSQS